MDDPSASGNPVDNESAATDNRGDATAGLFREPPASASQPPSATIGAVLSKDATSANEATAILRVSHAQGDNYRVVASTSAAFAAEPQPIQGAPVIGVGPGWLKDGQGQPLDAAFESTQVTQALTVWRTLHVEADRLVSTSPAADQQTLDLRGTFTGLKDRSLADSTGPFVEKTPPPTHWVRREGYDGWKGGDLRLAFHASDSYEVTANRSKDVDVDVNAPQPTLLNGLTTSQALQLPDRGYTLRDDDIASLTVAADPSLAEQLLAAAYIRVVTHGVGTQSTDIPFQITPFIYAGTGPLDRRNLMRQALYELPAEDRSSAEYWSIQLVSAFEEDPDGDLDPQAEIDLRSATKRSQANLGTTAIGSCHDGTRLIGGCKPHAAIYLEVMRDLLARPQNFNNLPALSVLNQRVTAHELLHGMTLIHGAAIMCAGVMLDAAPKGGVLDSIHVKQLRDVKQPEVLTSRRQSCP